VADLLCSNFTQEGETLVPQLRRPFRFLAEGFINGEEGMVEAAEPGLNSSWRAMSVSIRQHSTGSWPPSGMRDVAESLSAASPALFARKTT
jgi:hypothetical protein